MITRKIPQVAITRPRRDWQVIQQSARDASVEPAHPDRQVMGRIALALAAKLDSDKSELVTMSQTDDNWRTFLLRFQWDAPGISGRCMSVIDAIGRLLSQKEFQQDRPRPVIVDPKLVAWAKADLAK